LVPRRAVAVNPKIALMILRFQKHRNLVVFLFAALAAAGWLAGTASAQLQALMAPIAGCDDLDAVCPDLLDLPLCPDGETDDACEECPPGTDGPGEGCEGMPRFWVSSPYINIRIEDVPLTYPTARGKPMKFQLSYRQRGNLPEQPDIFGVGPNWSCNFRAYMVEITNSGVAGLPGWIRHHRGGAGFIDYNGTKQHWKLGSHASLIGDLNPVPCITYRNGTVDWFGRKFTRSNGTNYYFLSQRIDPAGRSTYFYYDSNPNVIRLTAVHDVDGNQVRIEYDPNFPNRIARVIDPYQRTNYLFYDSVSGVLEQIVDVARLTNSFTYDGSGWVDTLNTPYGTTRFRTMGYEAGSSTFFTGGGEVNRAVEVTLPGGGRHLYAYRHESTFLGGGYPPIQNAYGLPAMFDNDPVWRNSFHWGPLQYAALSSSYLNDPQPSSLTTDDYAIARLRHWLAPANGSGCSDALSLERQPSPDRATPGQVTWLDYAGKTVASCVGTSGLPWMVAQALPDGDTWLEAYQRNEYRKVTQKISTYTAPGATQLRTNTFVYTNEVDLALHIGPAGEQVVSNFYGALPHLPKVTVRGTSLPTTFDYNGYGQPTLVSNPAGLVTAMIYDQDRWLTNSYEYELKGGNVVYHHSAEMTYAQGLVQTRKNERGVTTTFYWDELSRPAGTSDPRGSTTNLYSALDLRASRDRLGFWTGYAHDNDRRLTYATNANQTVTRYGYCPCGLLESLTLGLGTDAQMMATFAYDLQGRQTNIFLPDTTLTRWFDALGQVERMTGPWGDRWFYYNNQGLLTCVSNRYGVELAAVYDIHDRPIYVTNTLGVTITNLYDELGRLLSRGYPDGGVEHFGYSARGLVTYTNQLGDTNLFAYNAAGQRTFQQNANGEVLQFFYDSSGNLTNLLDGRTNSTQWRFDQYGRATNKLDQAGMQVLAWRYDAGDRLISRQTPAKGTTWYTNDAVGNLLAINYPTSTDVFYAYDALNRLTNMNDAVGTTRFTYTEGGLPGTENGPFTSNTLTHVYANRLRTGLTLQQPTGTWTNGFRYDDVGRLTNVTSRAGSFGYLLGAMNPAGPLLKRLALPNSATITNTYDELGRLTGTFLMNSNGVSVLNKHEYTYNPGGQRVQQIRTDQTFVNYFYDGIGQLTNADCSVATEDRGYFYDKAWNLNRRTNNGAVSTFTVDAKSQLQTAAGANCTYDSNGNLVQVNNGVVTAYFYDDENQLVVITNGTGSAPPPMAAGALAQQQPATGGWKAEFTYDGQGRLRIRKDYYAFSTGYVLTNTTRYLYDGKRLIQERDASNVPTVSYTRGTDLSGSLQGAGGIGGLLARSHGYSAGNWTTHNYYHADGGGNVTCMINASRAMVASYRYDPFGNLVSKSGPLADANVYRFSSKEFHVNSGLYYYGYRFYSPNLQRWLNRDPIGIAGGLNLYGFVGNTPIGVVDPLGWSDDNRPVALTLGIVPELRQDILKREYYANCPPSDWVPLDEQVSLGNAIGYNYKRVTSETGRFGSVVQNGGGDLNWPRAGETPIKKSDVEQQARLEALGMLAQALLVMDGVGALAEGAGFRLLSGECAAKGATQAGGGIYEFTAASGKTYVGSSGDIAARLLQHLRSGKLLPEDLSTVSTTEVLGGKTAREIAEQLRIDELGGIKNLENIRNPIGPRRQHLLLPQP